MTPTAETTPLTGQSSAVGDAGPNGALNSLYHHASPPSLISTPLSLPPLVRIAESFDRDDAAGGAGSSGVNCEGNLLPNCEAHVL